MKVINTLTVSILASMTLLFTSCDKISSYMDELFNSERHPSQSKKSENLPSMAPQKEMYQKHTEPSPRETSNTEVSTHQSGPLFYLRGNKVSLFKAKNYPGAYALTFHGVGIDVLTFENKNGSELSNSLPLSQVLNNWDSDNSASANLILLRNLEGGIQKDVAIDLDIASPRYDSELKQLTFLVKPRTFIKTDYLGDNLGTAILLFLPGK